MKKLFLKIATVALVLSLSLTFVGCGLFQSSSNNNDTGELPSSKDLLYQVTYGQIEQSQRTLKSKTQVISEVRPSVVAISVQTEKSTSYGSGVIVDMQRKDENGNDLDAQSVFYILTCHHVVDGMGDVTVYLPDAEQDNFGESDYDAENYSFTGRIGNNMYPDKAVTLVGGDTKSDIALLKLDLSKSQTTLTPANVKAVSFPASDYKSEVGEDVIAIGNPSGKLPGTVSTGIISYINREATIGDVGDMVLYQIDLTIHHGSSGGALFNMYGELIGITNAGNDTYTGLNYAIPYVINSANDTDDNGFINIASQLLATRTDNNYGYVSGRVGLFGFTTTQEAIGESTQVKITEVLSGSLASQAGLMAGDVIKQIAKGEPANLLTAPNITLNEQVTQVVRSLKAGDKLSIKVERKTSYLPTTKTFTMTTKQFIFCDTGAA